eukprot:360817-Chlamydomonas_euryale.AAC.11
MKSCPRAGFFPLGGHLLVLVGGAGSACDTTQGLGFRKRPPMTSLHNTFASQHLSVLSIQATQPTTLTVNANLTSMHNAFSQ